MLYDCRDQIEYLVLQLSETKGGAAVGSPPMVEGAGAGNGTEVAAA